MDRTAARPRPRGRRGVPRGLCGRGDRPLARLAPLAPPGAERRPPLRADRDATGGAAGGLPRGVLRGPPGDLAGGARRAVRRLGAGRFQAAPGRSRDADRRGTRRPRPSVPSHRPIRRASLALTDDGERVESAIRSRVSDGPRRIRGRRPDRRRGDRVRPRRDARRVAGRPRPAPRVSRPGRARRAPRPGRSAAPRQRELRHGRLYGRRHRPGADPDSRPRRRGEERDRRTGPRERGSVRDTGERERV